MLFQKVTVSEAPKYANTRKITITGSHDIHITITDIDSPILSYSKLSECFIDGIWGRFFTNPLSLMLTYCHSNRVTKEMATEFLCGGHHLIAHYSHMASISLKRLQRLQNSIIRSGGIKGMLHIIFTERLEGIFKQRIISSLRHSPLH